MQQIRWDLGWDKLLGPVYTEELVSEAYRDIARVFGDRSVKREVGIDSLERLCGMCTLPFIKRGRGPQKYCCISCAKQAKALQQPKYLLQQKQKRKQLHNAKVNKIREKGDYPQMGKGQTASRTLGFPRANEVQAETAVF